MNPGNIGDHYIRSMPVRLVGGGGGLTNASILSHRPPPGADGFKNCARGTSYNLPPAQTIGSGQWASKPPLSPAAQGPNCAEV